MKKNYYYPGITRKVIDMEQGKLTPAEIVDLYIDIKYEMQLAHMSMGVMKIYEKLFNILIDIEIRFYKAIEKLPHEQIKMFLDFYSYGTDYVREKYNWGKK